MRFFVVPLLLFSLVGNAQECKLLRETDPYTKEVKISSGFLTLQGATVTIDADSKEIDFFFTVNGKCFNDASTVFIFFEGSRVRTTYRNAGSMNCDGYFHFKYRNSAGTNSVLQKLSTQKVAQFVFTGNDGKEVTVALLPEQQELLMNAAACVTKEGKELIKK